MGGPAVVSRALIGAGAESPRLSPAPDPRAGATAVPGTSAAGGAAGEDGGGARLPRLRTITARRDFVACARARKWVAPGLILQGRDRGPDANGEPARVGFTCSKKIGNAVTRNRAKRRLRAAARAVLPARARPGWDYVLIGRPGATVARPFADLLADLETAVAKLHRPPKPGGERAR